MKLYKVLSKNENGELTGAFYDDFVYSRDKVNQPLVDHARLFVFESLREARNWAKVTGRGDQIWSVEVDEKDVELSAAPFFVSGEWGPTSYWIYNWLKLKKSPSYPNNIPNGTLAVKKIKLLEFIQYAPNQQKCYKVVEKKGDELLPAFFQDAFRYSLGWNYSPCAKSRLFSFETLDQAKSYVHIRNPRHKNLQIWEARVKTNQIEKNPENFIAVEGLMGPTTDVIRRWLRGDEVDTSNADNVFTGTIATRAIKLICPTS